MPLQFPERRTVNVSVALLVTLLLIGCDSESVEPRQDSELSTSAPSSFELLNPELSNSVKQIGLAYVEQISSDLDLVGLELEKFQSAVRAILNFPSDPNLNAAKQAWLSAHSAYELTTLHRYFAMQVFEEQDRLALLQLQYQVNHWPIVPGYIDYVEGYPDSGVVHDFNVNLDSASLREQHGLFDVAEVTLGFHVLEFLLWGGPSDSSARAVTDYLAVEELDQLLAESGYSLEQLSNNRRRRLLSIVTATLVEDFQAMQDLWLAQAPIISQQVEAISATELIVLLTNSMSAMLTEELLLRSLYPMLNGDIMESNQSPFSKSTQNAVSSQLSGLERLLLERQTEDGTTLDLIFSGISDEFSEFFYQNFDASKSCLVLLYSNLAGPDEIGAVERETEVVECINLLTNMIDYNERLKFDLTN